MKELEGIRKLFSWDRVVKAAGPLNRKLKKAGFDGLEMSGGEAVSESFRVEFEERWPSAFSRFQELADRAAEELGAAEEKGSGKRSAKANKG